MPIAVPCFHCGETCPANPPRAPIHDTEQAFCCLGCKAVAEVIAEQGLVDFYRFREGVNTRVECPEEDFSAFDLPAVAQDFAEQGDDGLIRAHLFLPDVHCAACVWLIEGTLKRLDGVQSIAVNASQQSAAVVFKQTELPLSRIFQRLSAVGYKPQPLLAENQQAAWQAQRKDDLLRLGVAGIGMMQAGMVAVALHAGDLQGIDYRWQQTLRYVSLMLTLPIIAYSALPFFRSALSALRLRRVNMDVPVALALLLAFSASASATVTGAGQVYFDSVAMFTFFLLLGRFLEKRARWRNARARVRRLQLLPQTVALLESGGCRTLARKQVAVGQRVWLAPGGVIPCDGTVVDGVGEVNEAIVTGESTPVTKRVGDRIIAGSLNGGTALTAEVTAVGRATELASIERLVDEAQVAKPSQVSLADALAARFVKAILVVTVFVGTFWLWHEPSRALWVVLSVLVVTCPCALSLATPAVLAAAIDRLREQGVLITGANSLETLTRVDEVWFDKTGTLTTGKLRVAEVLTLADLDRGQVLEIAAALERGTAHPIAEAFAGIPDTIRVRGAETSIGSGVSGVIANKRWRLGTPAFVLPELPTAYPGDGLWLLLAEGERAVAWLRLEDTLRAEAKAVVNALAERGLKTAIVSGDRRCNVGDLAATLDIAEWASNLSPAAKLSCLERAQRRGAVVLMVGDGINDVPVLARAAVSAVMGSATEFARHRADCVLLGDELGELPRLFAVAGQVKSIIRQNFAWALAYNALALPLAAAGLVPPWAAAIGMSASSLVVVLNALRVGRALDPGSEFALAR